MLHSPISFQDAGAPDRLKGKQRVALLKEIEGLTREIFQRHGAFEQQRDVLGPGQRGQILSAVLDQQWTGIQEYSETFFTVLECSVKRQQLQRYFVRTALDSLDHGFDALDRNLLYHASLVADEYDIWYRRWAQTVQGNETARRLAEDDKAGKVPKELYNHYTVISLDEATGTYTQSANARYFQEEVTAIVGTFDRWIAELQRVDAGDADLKEAYLDYLSQYRACLAETDIDKLESEWTVLDQKWMRIKHWIQIVHDIESGYGDPLRCKVSPEFSTRLLDETYEHENARIQEIQGHMVAYFKGRQGALAKSGLGALQKSMAGLYYLPFQCAVSLFFRFSGQSIPNRSEVRHQHGVKIYCDPVSTAAREVFARDLAASMCSDPAMKDSIDTVETIVYHVASHEIGHAIYGLDNLKSVIKVSTKTLLEEPRAELTALHTLRLLLEAGMITQAQVEKMVASFMLQDLRRFAMFDSSATRPYTVSAMACWARAHRLAYITLDRQGKVVFDHSKVAAFLDESSHSFEAILDAEDRNDGTAIEQILGDMETAEKEKIVQHLVEELFNKPKAEKHQS